MTTGNPVAYIVVAHISGHDAPMHQFQGASEPDVWAKILAAEPDLGRNYTGQPGVTREMLRTRMNNLLSERRWRIVPLFAQTQPTPEQIAAHDVARVISRTDAEIDRREQIDPFVGQHVIRIDPGNP